MADNSDENPAPAPENAPRSDAPAPTPAPAAPPAATAVINGKSERELQLERELEEARAGRKTAETIAAEKEDEAKRLKDAQQQQPAPKARKAKPLLQTFFHEPEGE